MEITSLDANPITPDTRHDSKEDSNFNIEEIQRLNNAINNVNIPIPNAVSKLEFEQDGATTTFAEGLAGLKLSHSKQKGDCLYLYSKDHEVNAATTILKAIAPNTQDLESSILYSEGIHRLKLHGNDWALGLDLPIMQSAIVATEIIAAILTTFRQDSQLIPKLAQTKLKLLLQNNCLNLLCETPVAILQAEMALPMLNTLRMMRAAEYFQSVTVSSRVIGEKKPSWSFEIDLLAIGQPEQTPESELEIEQRDVSEIDPQERETVSYSFQDSLESKSQLFTILKDIFCLRWLGQPAPTMISLPTCLASLALGIGVTVVIDRTLNSYRQVEQPNKLLLADSKIDLSVNQMTEAKDGKVINKPAPNFNIALLNEKLAILDWQTNNKKHSPDVLIVGSSRALRGIEPQTLETALNQKGYQNISVFNFGIDGATAKVVNLQLTEMLSLPQLPKMIIWADGLRAFNSSRNDLTYDEITTSAGYKQLQANLKNNNKPIDTSTAIAIESTDLITQSFSSLLTSLSNRQEVRTALVKKFDRNTQMLSNSEALVAATMPSTVTALDIKGFVAFDVTFDPDTYFQKFPQVPGDYDLDYRNFETNGNQFDAFNNVVEFCRRNNITLLVVNMPLHSTYLDSIRTSYEAIFNSKMKELARREGFTYLDLSQIIQNQAELFSDPSHLNQKGAVAIANLISQNPQIPWQKLRK